MSRSRFRATASRLPPAAWRGRRGVRLVGDDVGARSFGRHRPVSVHQRRRPNLNHDPACQRQASPRGGRAHVAYTAVSSNPTASTKSGSRQGLLAVRGPDLRRGRAGTDLLSFPPVLSCPQDFDISELFGRAHAERTRDLAKRARQVTWSQTRAFPRSANAPVPGADLNGQCRRARSKRMPATAFVESGLCGIARRGGCSIRRHRPRSPILTLPSQRA